MIDDDLNEVHIGAVLAEITDPSAKVLIPEEAAPQFLDDCARP